MNLFDAGAERAALASGRPLSQERAALMFPEPEPISDGLFDAAPDEGCPSHGDPDCRACQADEADPLESWENPDAAPVEVPATPAPITITYRSVDGARIRKTFKTIDGARRFAQKYVGRHADVGSTYAVSFDGIGKVSAEGCKLADLFPEATE